MKTLAVRWDPVPRIHIYPGKMHQVQILAITLQWIRMLTNAHLMLVSPNLVSPGWMLTVQPRSCCLQHLKVQLYSCTPKEFLIILSVCP